MIDLSNVIALALGSDDVLQIQDAIGTVLWQKIIYYNVNISAGSNGSVSVNGVSGNYSQSVPSGTVLIIEGTGNTDYNFNQWSDGVSTNPRTLTVTSNTTLSAAFAIDTYSVTISAGANGSISVNGTPVVGTYTDTVSYGTTLTLAATGDAGYGFDQWSDGNTDNPRTLTVTSDVTLMASFQAVTPPQQPNDEFWYTTSDGNMLTVSSPFDANIVSHTYTNGKGIIKCNSNITTVNNSGFNSQLTLETFSLPDSVTTISPNAFSMSAGANSSMLSCKIGSGVTSIGNYAFSNNVNLTSFTIYATTPPTADWTMFYNDNSLTIYVPAASVEAYKATSGWSTHKAKIQAIP